jgi:outer membrane protein assembly factor BamA
MAGRNRRRSRHGVLLVVLALTVSVVAVGQSNPRTQLQLQPTDDLSGMVGKPVARIEIVALGERWAPTKPLTRVVPGQLFHPSLARQAMQELAATGLFADLRSEVELSERGVILRLTVLPRRLIAQIKIPGGVLSEEATFRALELARDKPITVFDAEKIQFQARDYYRSKGFHGATARVEILDTDKPAYVVLLIRVDPGPREPLTRVYFSVDPPVGLQLQNVLNGYRITRGEPADEEEISAADQELQIQLKALGWVDASVTHRLLQDQALDVRVQQGSQVRIRFEGNRNFDDTELLTALQLAKSEDRSETTLLARLRDFYQARGFFDVQLQVRYQGRRPDPQVDQVFVIRELQPVRVVRREYPCLTGPRNAADVDAEIDGVLSSVLPGAGLLGPPEPSIGQAHRFEAAAVHRQEPWQIYSADAYARALKHVQDLYRSEGYLSASVGPVSVQRRTCDPRLGPGQCQPLGKLQVQPCSAVRANVSMPEAQNCRYDPQLGLRCDPNVVLQIPIQLGPQATLYDLKFEGNRSFVETQLQDMAEIELGQPASYVELEKAQRRILDAYADEGFAFATVEGELQLSADRTRARAAFVIGEREQVRVKDIVVQGALRTNESLILNRARFEPGDIYRRSDARRTEELLSTLGVFSSVSVLLRDPEVPAKEKTVLIVVRERESQYLEVRPGVSTGEGARLTLEYGHRNLGGEAIQFRLRSQLGFLPDALILESEVRRKYGELPISRRLERRNTASLEFPSIGLGPLFRLTVEGVDVRDNSRDYGITKDAAILTLSFRPQVELTAALRGSLELNNAEVFGQDEKNALQTYLQQHNSPLLQRLLNVPQGQTLAVAQRASVLWDERDNPFGATRGTLLSFSAEHVKAYSLEKDLDLTSHFMHYLMRVAGYVRLSQGGLAWATSLGLGYNQQLENDSQTYPDRFFFMGGADSLRGFLQASLVPEDIAQNILDVNNPLSINEVTIRGGDVSINPRTELRIPLSATWQTAIFVDAGNLWLDARRVDPTVLRYAAGSGLRATTPVGPLALDYGINLDRRPWEDFGAFHFSIGLF